MSGWRNLSIYTRVLFIPKNHSGESRSAPLDLGLNPDRPDLAESATTILKRIDDHLSHDLLYSINIGVILKLHDDSGFTVIFGDSDRNSRGDQTAGCASVYRSIGDRYQPPFGEFQLIRFDLFSSRW